MKKLRVETRSSYDVIIENGSIHNIADYIKNISSLKSSMRIAIITDDNVGPLYCKSVKESLESIGFKVNVFTFKAGEISKNLTTVNFIYHFLSSNSISRKDLILALGGGVVGDIAGFAAATYLRGINFIQIPTSLLAQIDSSVGGKTGVDIAEGKNLVGAFWQPSLVVIDPQVLKTLASRYFSDGLAEAIKYGCIKSDTLFNRLLNENPNDFIEDLIYSCVKIKSDVVSEDEFESGKRMLLNFGHTMGHAIEKLYGFSKLSHGEAVGVGMLMAAQAGEKNKLTKQRSSKLVYDVLNKYNLPTSVDLPVKDILEASFNDKKSVGDYINFVLLEDIGKAFVKKIKKAELFNFVDCL